MALKGDPFRRDYGKLTSTQGDLASETKQMFESVWAMLDRVEMVMGSSRDLSVARTELQTSCMWAVRACTKTGDQE